MQTGASHCFDLSTRGDCGLIYNVFDRVCRTISDTKSGYTQTEKTPEKICQDTREAKLKIMGK